MRGSLGEKIGQGAMADIHAWASGQVVKLYKPGREQRLSRHEAQMTRAVFAAGLPAPEVFDEVTLEGRFGIVLSRLDGPTLLQLLRTRAMTPEQAGAILAALSISVHKTPPPPGVISLPDLIRALVQSPSNLLPKHLATGVLALLESLPPGDALCHGDHHPGNVIVLSLLMFPAMVIRYNMGFYEMMIVDVPLFLGATMSVCSFYLMSQREVAESTLRKDVLGAILQEYLQASPTDLDAKVLQLELLSNNFHDSLVLRPLFHDLQRKLL